MRITNYYMGTSTFNLLDIAIAYWRLRKIKRYFDSKDLVLDFGCGYQAFLLHHLEGKIKKGVGLDYDLGEEIDTHSLVLKKFRFKNSLPFQDNYFTKVTLLAVLEHLDLSLIPLLFAEIKRVLKPEGIIILTTPTPKSKPLMEFLANKIGIISRLEIMDHKKYYAKKDLEKIAKDHDLILSEYCLFQFGLNSFAVLTKS